MRDQRFENLLVGEGVKFEYMPSMPLEAIDIKAGLRNQARTDQLDEKTTDSYCIAMLNGASFPAIIVYPHGLRFVPIDGNHRIEAARRAKHSTLDAYVVRTLDSAVIARLTRTANTVEGRRATPEELLGHATFAVENWGWSIHDAAKQWGLAESKLGTHIRSRAARCRAIRHGIDASAVVDTRMDRINSIKNDRPFSEALRLNMSYQVPMLDLEDKVTQLNRLRSESEQLSFIAEWEQSLVPKEAKGKRSPTQELPVQKLMRLLGQISRLLDDYPVAEAWEIPGNGFRAKITERKNTVLPKLEAIIGR
jgi:hypothetical protein